MPALRLSSVWGRGSRTPADSRAMVARSDVLAAQRSSRDGRTSAEAGMRPSTTATSPPAATTTSVATIPSTNPRITAPSTLAGTGWFPCCLGRLHEEVDGHAHAYRDDEPADDSGLDAACDARPIISAEDRADGDDGGNGPRDLSGRGKRDDGDAVDARREQRLDGVHSVDRAPACQREERQQQDAHPRTEVPAVDRHEQQRHVDLRRELVRGRCRMAHEQPQAIAAGE